ncbi:MAG TPA: serine hydrolase domain-containing protein [Nitriliruptorales bacterium]
MTSRRWPGGQPKRAAPLPDAMTDVTDATDATDVTNQALAAALRAYIPEVMRQHHVPGITVAVSRHGETVLAEGFGFADLDQQRPMTADTVFRSGSMGKTYTATAILQLVEQGVIDLYDPINQHLPFMVRNPLGHREITVEDLLTHRAGLARNAAGSTFAPPPALRDHLEAGYRDQTHDSFHGTVTDKWIVPVGEAFNYSNTGIATLGLIVECANPDGLTFTEYVQRHILDPLGMASSQFPPVHAAPHARQDLLDRLGTGYCGFGPVNLPTPEIFFADYPAGNILTIASDHIRVLEAYLGAGTRDGQQLLRPQTVREALTPRVAIGASGETVGGGVGLIWVIDNVGRPDHWFGHGGAHMWGWDNDYRAYPELGLAVAVATNRWDMIQRSPGAAFRRPRDLIGGYAADFLIRGGPATTSHSYAWRVSYVIGLKFVESTRGGLGIAEPITNQMVEAMASGARLVAPGSVDLWDEDGFRTGVKDLVDVEPTLPGFRVAFASGQLAVDPVEFELIHRDLEGRGALQFAALS